MRFGDAEIGEHQGGGFGLHRAAAIGMQGELAGRAKGAERQPFKYTLNDARSASRPI
jgi:hypothetical protein